MIFNKNKNTVKEYLDVTFVAKDEFTAEATQAPVPARTMVPEWYKDMSTHKTKHPDFDKNFGNQNTTFKACMPFFDSWTFGYIAVTPCDLVVEVGFDETDIKIHANKIFDLIGYRGAPYKHSMPIPDDYYQLEFTWQTHWEAHTPEGYSSFYTHPINRPELPFYTISGVMDTDKWYATGNHPFFLKKGFEGIIPMGTPMMSIIPFKRDTWKSDKRSMRPMEYNVLNSKVRRHASSGYKKEMWQRKDFS